MNPGDDSEFEQELRGMALRQPPAEWKALLLPGAVPALFGKVFWFGLAACWAACLGFVLATPASENLGPPILPPSDSPALADTALAYQPK